MKKLTPKTENAGIGFSYTVTDEQIEKHEKRSIPEILAWLESTRKLINAVQTPDAKEFARKLKHKKNWL